MRACRVPGLARVRGGVPGVSRCRGWRCDPASQCAGRPRGRGQPGGAGGVLPGRSGLWPAGVAVQHAGWAQDPAGEIPAAGRVAELCAGRSRCDDFADGFVWLVPLPDGTVLRRARAECTGACRLELAPKAAGEVVVLAGFDIRRAENDGHVRRFAVGPVIGTATAPEMRVDFRDDDFAYSVEVQYAYLPPGAVAGTGDVAQSYARNDGGFGTAVVRNPSFPDPALRAETGEGDLVLQFFAFAFGNGGHFLEDIGVERRMGEYEAWFQDNQGRGERRHPDDPFDWRAGFVRLRQGLRRRRAPAAGRWPSRPARARSRDSRRWRSASPAGPSPSGSAWRTPPSSSR